VPPRRGRKRKATQADQDDVEVQGEGDPEGDEISGGRRKKEPRRQRSVTPENAEEIEVDVRQVKMADLVKDLRIGKKFSRHDELLERERAKRRKYYLERAAKKHDISVEELLAQRAEGTAAQSGETGHDSTPAPNGAADAAIATPAPTDSDPNNQGAAGQSTGPQFQIVDGQIVVDARSLQVDRQARAAAAAGELEEEEENDFTRHVTSSTYLRRKAGPNYWSPADTEKFYRALSMFGTDFMMISEMFPSKSRRQVKQKFNREERYCPRRINAALVGEKTVPMDMEEYKRHTGEEYQEVGEIEAETRRIEEEYEAEQRRIEEEAAEEARKKREALFGNNADENDHDDDGGNGEAASTAKGKGRRRGKGGKGKRHQLGKMLPSGFGN
jgi:transcription factor TFIIIB component B''